MPLSLFPALTTFVNALPTEFDQIPASRKVLLDSVASYIGKSLPVVNLTFICTHNSRRSHFAQIWAAVGACYYGIGGESFQTYSGGTETTAMNPRAVEAMRRAGFEIEVLVGSEHGDVSILSEAGHVSVNADGDDVSDISDGTAKNPRYSIRFAPNQAPLIAYSKRFDAPENPSTGFAAVMTCSEADEACPFVPECDQRFALTYRDPKEADGTPEETRVYDERCRQIARDLFYVMSRV